jgi:hypothetical protein
MIKTTAMGYPELVQIKVLGHYRPRGEVPNWLGVGHYQQ